MDRTIKVTSDRENSITKKLNAIGREKERIAQLDFNLTEALYSAIFFVPLSEDKNVVLGTFYSKEKTIILSESLLDSNIKYDDIKNVFLHELSHALDYCINDELSGHSSRFRAYSEYLGVEKGFEKAKIKSNLLRENRDRERIQKLMALSTSPFENEAAIAVKKAQDLLLDLKSKNTNQDKLYYVTLAESKRFSIYYPSLTKFISKASGVFIIKCKTKATQELRAYGELEQVEFALYLYDYIDSSINKEIKKLRKQGVHVTKDSFALGAIPELEKKLINLDKEDKNAIILIHTENERRARTIVFKEGIRRVSYNSKSISAESMKTGSKFGKSLKFPDKVNRKVLI